MLMVQLLLGPRRGSIAAILRGLFREDAWSPSPSRRSAVGVLRPWSGFVERRMLWLRLTLRLRPLDIGGRWQSSTLGIPVSPWRCRKETLLASSKLGEFGALQISSERAAGRRTSRICCEKPRLERLLGAMDAKDAAALPSWR